MVNTSIPPKARGFTIVEIILVVIIVSVMAVMSVPNFRRSFDRMQLNETAQDIAFLIRYAQSRAISHNKNVRFVFNAIRTKYWLEDAEDENETPPPVAEQPKIGGPALRYVPILGTSGRIHKVPEELAISWAGEEIRFFSDGRIDGSRIVICRKDDCKTVSTQEQRGYVQIFDYAIP